MFLRALRILFKLGLALVAGATWGLVLWALLAASADALATLASYFVDIAALNKLTAPIFSTWTYYCFIGAIVFTLIYKTRKTLWI